MPKIACCICGEKFYAKPHHIQRGWGKYCSRPCQYKGQHTGKEVSCAACGKGVYRTQKDMRKSRSGKFFCNKSCLATFKNQLVPSGEDHFNWRHGKNAYRNILLRNKVPPKCAGCGIKDKRILVAHHIDQNRENNTIGNLKWLCRNCHYLEHDGRTL